MSQMCNSIDTLSMSYLDEELAAEEKREVELHLLECASCREKVSEERQEVLMLRQRLAAPAVPALVRAKTMRLLDREDAQVGRALLRERLARWLLPGTSFAVAAAALLVFVFFREPANKTSLGEVASSRSLEAMQVTGAATTDVWLQQQIAGTNAPRFDGIELVGGSHAIFRGQPVAKLMYEVGTRGPQRFRLEAYLFRPRNGDIEIGRPVQFAGRTLYVSTIDDLPSVTYRDEQNVGYLFVSRDLSQRALLELVLQSDLIDRDGLR
jgi:anti-sigma factor RsiW